MSETKYVVVPEGMLKAATIHVRGSMVEMAVEDGVEKALRWLSENPIVPGNIEAATLMDGVDHQIFGIDSVKWMATEWQRRMFLAPDPEIPEAVKGLMWDDKIDKTAPRWRVNQDILEAYRRGALSQNEK